MAEDLRAIAEDKRELMFVARMGAKHHEDRESHYSSVLKWASGLSVVFASAAFIGLGNVLPQVTDVSKDLFVALFAVLVTVLNAWVLSAGLSSKAQLHGALRRKWLEVERDLVLMDENQDPAELTKEMAAITRRAYQIHGEEPPASPSERRKAYNFAVDSLGYDVNHKIGFFDMRQKQSMV